MNNEQPNLRTLAEKRGLLIGAALNHGAFAADAAYRETAARELNFLTCENEMKWERISPERGKYGFAAPDAMVAFAERNKMAVHGHTFVWHWQLPEWLKNGTFNRGELITILRAHIATLLGHYQGKVAVWDVVNEAIDDKSFKLRESVWSTGIGPDFIEQAFRMAHEIDPAVKLVYNDYGAENLNPKSDAIYALLKDLKARGVPVHGVGFQAHVTPADIDQAQFARNLQRFADLGLEIYITELDVRLPENPTAAALVDQARVYGDILKTCLAQPAVKGIQTWGFTDKYSWIPHFFKGFGDALLFDKDYKPKPAYAAVKESLAGR